MVDNLKIIRTMQSFCYKKFHFGIKLSYLIQYGLLSLNLFHIIVYCAFLMVLTVSVLSQPVFMKEFGAIQSLNLCG